MVDSARKKLEEILLGIGAKELGELWDVSTAEASRRINNDRGVTVAQLAEALDKAGVKLLTGNDIVISRAKYESVLAWAADGISIEQGRLRGMHMRASDKE